MRRSTSAFTTIALIVILAIVGVAGYGVIQIKDALAPSRPAKAVAALDVSAQASFVASQKAQADLQAAIKADQAKYDAEKAKEQQASGFNAGVGIALNSEPNPSINVRVASTLQAEVAKTLDPASAAQVANDQVIIAQLRASNNTTSIALAATQKQRDEALETAKVAAAQAQVSDDQAKLSAAQTVAATAETKTLSAKLKVWADNNVGLLARIKHLTLGVGILVALIVLIGWLLPLVGKAFPEVPILATIAKRAAAPFLLVLHLLHEGEKKALIAAHDATKLELVKVQSAFVNEQAAHAATQASLIKIATTPDTPPTAPATVSSLTPQVSAT